MCVNSWPLASRSADAESLEIQMAFLPPLSPLREKNEANLNMLCEPIKVDADPFRISNRETLL
jgi:hypothetical protein